MARLPSESRKAANGFDSTNDLSLLQPNRALKVENLVSSRAGILTGLPQPTRFYNFPNGCDGIFQYQGDEEGEDLLLIISGGILYTSRFDFPSPVGIGGGFLTGQQVRGVQFDDEFFFVQEGGIQPLRFNGTSLSPLGVSAPTAPPTAVGGVPTGGAASNKSGVVQYRYRFLDEKLRESEPSPSVTLDYTATSYDGYITLFSTWEGIDPQVTAAVIEATTAAGSVFYQIATLQRDEGEVTYEDNLSSTTVQSGTVSTGIGRRDVPNRASAIASHKNYLWLNDVESPRQLQISSLNAPTYFPTVTEIPASDGGRMTIPGARGGNPIIQIKPFGSLLILWLKQGIVQIWGETLQSFKPRELHVRGTVAPGSAERTDNELPFLIGDGVYRVNYEGLFINSKISEEIDETLRSYSPEARNRALAAYCTSRYCLSLGDKIFVYDYTSPGWTTINLNTSLGVLADAAKLFGTKLSLDNPIGGGGGGGDNGGGGGPMLGQAPVEPTEPEV